MKCPKCGTDLTKEDVFCPECGHKVEKEKWMPEQIEEEVHFGKEIIKSNKSKKWLLIGAIVLLLIMGTSFIYSISYKDCTNYCSAEVCKTNYCAFSLVGFSCMKDVQNNCCGNNICEKSSEYTETYEICEVDCEYIESCGNGRCGVNENKCTCAQDCGVCSGSTGTCNEYYCEGNECITRTKYNCCGNGICDSNENYGSCSQDCKYVEQCGNNICGDGENCNTCEKDCGVCLKLTLGVLNSPNYGAGWKNLLCIDYPDTYRQYDKYFKVYINGILEDEVSIPRGYTSVHGVYCPDEYMAWGCREGSTTDEDACIGRKYSGNVVAIKIVMTANNQEASASRIVHFEKEIVE